ncbi:hypothetical protein ACWGJW_06440 [Streptomyces nigrescens]
MVSGLWFAVLPDGEAGRAAARQLSPHAPTVLTHGSGRPWVLGTWPQEQMTVAAAGTARMAVIGRCPVTAAELSARLARVRDVEESVRAVAELPGCFHVIVTIGGRVRVRGTATAVRRVFYTRLGGTTVAADRCDVLGPAVGAGVDEQVPAARLLPPGVLHELEKRSVWQGVTGVPADHCLVLESDGHAATRRWWRRVRLVAGQRCREPDRLVAPTGRSLPSRTRRCNRRWPARSGCVPQPPTPSPPKECDDSRSA